MLALLRKRRSIRKFAKKTVPALLVRRLTEALLRSPSSRDLKPWHFIIVDDPALLRKLALSKDHGSEFLAQAPLGIVVCGNERVSDVWIEDCSIASIIVQLAALKPGLGSCWIQLRNRKTATGESSERFVQGLLGLPSHVRVESIIAFGYPAEKKRPVPLGKLSYNKIHRNGFKPI